MVGMIDGKRKKEREREKAKERKKKIKVLIQRVGLGEIVSLFILPINPHGQFF